MLKSVGNSNPKIGFMTSESAPNYLRSFAKFFKEFSKRSWLLVTKKWYEIKKIWTRPWFQERSWTGHKIKQWDFNCNFEPAGSYLSPDVIQVYGTNAQDTFDAFILMEFDRNGTITHWQIYKELLTAPTFYKWVCYAFSTRIYRKPSLRMGGILSLPIPTGDWPAGFKRAEQFIWCLSLSFLFCKMMIIIPTLLGYFEN